MIGMILGIVLLCLAISLIALMAKFIWFRFWESPRWFRVAIGVGLFSALFLFPAFMVYRGHDEFVWVFAALGLVRIGVQIRHWIRPNKASGNPPKLGRGNLPA